MLDKIAGIQWYSEAAREFPGVHAILEGLHRESRLTASEWYSLREQRLRALLVAASKRVPYYSHVFRQCGFDPESAQLPSNLTRIPILEKNRIREHRRELVASGCSESMLLRNATGGSTGVPLEFYQDRQYQTTAAALDAYVRAWWGVRPYDRTALVWGADRELASLSWKDRFYAWRRRTRSLNAFRMNEDRLRDFCRLLARWRPPYLMGYASALETLAIFARNCGEDLQFSAIRSTAEVLRPPQRELIEGVFHSPVYDFYGSREVNNIAAECPEQRQLHVISTWRYVEVVDEKGHPVPDGCPGYIAVTDLSNYAMPFIRYRNEDMAILSADPCPCGRPTPVLKSLLGRSSDMIRTPGGELVHGEFFTHLFYGCDNIRQFQVIQKSLFRVIVRYVPSGRGHEAAMDRIVQGIRERLGDEVTVEIEVCDHIDTPESGKYRFTISEVSTQ